MIFFYWPHKSGLGTLPLQNEFNCIFYSINNLYAYKQHYISWQLMNMKFTKVGFQVVGMRGVQKLHKSIGS